MYASTHPPQAFGLTITPVKGPATIGSTQAVTVWNLGHHNLQVTMSAREIIRTKEGKCQVAPRDATWARVTPARFTLQPNHHQQTILHITGTPSPGEHDLVAWATTPAGTTQVGRTILHTDASVGSQFLVRVPGPQTSTQAPCVSLATPQHAMSDFPVLPTALAAIATLALLLAVWAVLLRKRRRAA